MPVCDMPVQEGDELSVLEEGSAGGAFGAAQAHADANAAEGGLSINQRFQDLLMSWSTSANTKREALKRLGMYHGAWRRESISR